MDFCYRVYPARNACNVIGRVLIQWLIVILGFVSLTALASAQASGIPSVSQEELASHLARYIAPTYPESAQSSRVEGRVLVKVELGPDGLVRSTRVLSGPVLLRSPAVSALKKWRYTPFHSDNETIAVTGNVLLIFTLRDKPAVHTPHEPSANGSNSVQITFPPSDHHGEPDAEIASRFDVPWDTCTRGVIARATDVTTANACKQAVAIAEEFPPDRRFVERRRAYVYAATAYGNIHDLKTALQYANKAVELVKLGHDDNLGIESAYSIRGEIRAFSDDLSGGDQDLTIAEDFCRKGQLADALKQNLQFHAELLKRLNRPEEAQAKLSEAAKL